MAIAMSGPRAYTPAEAEALARKASRTRLEDAFAARLAAAGVPAPVREHRFHAGRAWRFDFAWPAAKVAVEIDGGTHSGGRHVRGSGFERDCEKLNAATLDGWRVLRFTAGMSRQAKAVDAVALALATDDSGDTYTR